MVASVRPSTTRTPRHSGRRWVKEIRAMRRRNSAPRCLKGLVRTAAANRLWLGFFIDESQRNFRHHLAGDPRHGGSEIPPPSATPASGASRQRVGLEPRATGRRLADPLTAVIYNNRWRHRTVAVAMPRAAGAAGSQEILLLSTTGKSQPHLCRAVFKLTTAAGRSVATCVDKETPAGAANQAPLLHQTFEPATPRPWSPARASPIADRDDASPQDWRHLGGSCHRR